MKFITLGTACGFPVKGRGCEANLLEVNGSIYFFDAGVSLAEALANLEYDYNAVKAVFITHAHTDHINTVGQLVNLSTWRYKEMRFGVYVPTQSCVDFARLLSESIDKGKIDEERVTFTIYDNGVIYQDENIKVTAFHSAHIEKAHSFLVEAEGKRLFITGDLESTMESLSSEATEKSNDFILVECAHFPESVVLDVFPKLNAKRVVITHIGRTVPIEKVQQFIDEGKIKGEIADDYQEFII